SLSSRCIPSDESLPKALSKSCNFPFAFTGSGSDLTDVDGGLALNLPLDDLKANPSAGEVIAITFSPKFYRREGHPLISFAKSLFAAAVQSGVERSRTIADNRNDPDCEEEEKQNVFIIDTEIDTFDFGKALDIGLKAEYRGQGCVPFRYRWD